MNSFKAIAVLIGAAALVVSCGETFTGIYQGDMQIVNQRNCIGSRPGSPQVQVAARIDGDAVTLRLYSSERSSVLDIERLEGTFTDDEKAQQNNYYVIGHGDFSQDRQYLTFQAQITKPNYDPTIGAANPDEPCQQTYRLQRAQLIE